MRVVLGAIDTAPGTTRHARVHAVAGMNFLDEDGNSRRFTWYRRKPTNRPSWAFVGRSSRRGSPVRSR